MGRPVGASGGSGQCITQTGTQVFAAGRSVHFVEFPPKHKESECLWNRLPLVGVVTKPPQMPVAESGQEGKEARGLPRLSGSPNGCSRLRPAYPLLRNTGIGTGASESRALRHGPPGLKPRTIDRFWGGSAGNSLPPTPIRCSPLRGMLASLPTDFCHVFGGPVSCDPENSLLGWQGSAPGWARLRNRFVPWRDRDASTRRRLPSGFVTGLRIRFSPQSLISQAGGSHVQGIMADDSARSLQSSVAAARPTAA